LPFALERVGFKEAGVPKPFHLAWFTNFTAGSWDTTFSHGGSPWDGKFYVEFAQAMERACFDYVILEDTLMVSEAWAGAAEMSLTQRLTENELGDFSRLWHDGCGVAIIEAQDVDRNHSPQV
jgi:hypothetical protein